LTKQLRFDASGPELERRNSGTTLRFIIPLPVSLHPMAQKTHFAILPSPEGGAKKGMIRLVIVEDEPEMLATLRWLFAAVAGHLIACFREAATRCTATFGPFTASCTSTTASRRCGKP
jgi:hypothetical protein